MTLDEIFAAMPEAAAEDAHEVLYIDPATRQIDVPDAELILGVEADGQTERKYFACPRYVGAGIDLAACFLRVNYRNANGVVDAYLVEDAAVNGEYVTFSWELRSKVTAYKGKVQFIVCAILPGSSNTYPEWNTTLASGTVLEGLEPDGAAAEAATADVIAQLLALVERQAAAVTAEGSTQIAAVQKAAQEATSAAQEAIEAKGAATLATIPADYTTLDSQVDKLTRTTAGAIVCQAEGETIQVHDSSDNYLPGLRLFGKTTQVKTTGAQLLDFSAMEMDSGGTTKANIKNSGQVVQITGTKAYAMGYIEVDVSALAGKVIYLSGEKSGGNNPSLTVRLIKADGTKTYITTATTGYTVLADDAAIQIQFIANNTAAVLDAATTATFNEVMLSLTQGAAWEPYSGGVASPSPAWPQELQSVTPVVTVGGANIFDVSKMDAHANTALEVTDDGETITATGGGDKPYTSSILQLDVAALRGNTLIMTADSIVNSNANGKGGVQLNINRTTKTDYEAISAASLTRSLYISDDVTDLYIAVYTNNTANALETDNVVTVKGLRLNINQPAPWCKYTPLQAMSAPSALPGIPVETGGNYTDANGQQWICDEVDLARGVYVQRVLETVVTDAPKFNETADYPGRFSWFCLPEEYANGRAACLLNFANWNGWGFSDGLKDCGAVSGNQMYYSPVQNMTADEVNEYFAQMIASGKPPVVLAQLTTPVELPLAEAELAAWRNLHSNKPTTTLLNDAGAYMAAEYVADTKLYIDRKIVELLAAGNT